MNLVKGIILLHRYLILLSVFFILITALLAFIYASLETTQLWWTLLRNHWHINKVDFHFIEIIERFLTVIALLILGIGLYELFIEPMSLPEPLKVNNFHDLKSSLGNIILLNMVVIFFGDLAEGKDSQDLVFQALATSIICAILIWFSHAGHGSKELSTSNTSLER
ncbi:MULTISPECIES: YqhA family protein [unclassified Synechocystis]|uniref:YqhA family protein n=1 Tax=unclassified Synechocystis TaxID=2640012 RepID=UPI0004103653|nr:MULTISPECIES: YqhA family protein [unclassified Synechocystis]AIE75860.1 hypothetical protein D082_33320 [Synechocystis sp. PCC 6714]MCT0255211.1 YqhA family protein [Synechocystis sp. CS-94]